MTPERRGRDDGGLYQRHDHASCPPLVDGVRADHACRGRWVATVDLGVVSGKRRRKTLYGKTRKAAKIKLDRALKEKHDHVLVTGTRTVEQWMTYWLDVICVERGLKVNTMKSHRSKVETYIVPHLGHYRLDRLEPEHVRAMYAEMSKPKPRRDKKGQPVLGDDGKPVMDPPLSDATRRQTHAVLRRALMVAQREGKVSRNVADLLDPPKVPKNKRMVRLSRADVTKIRATENLRAHVALLGLRQGEALALRWSDVDLELGWLEVSRSLARQPGVGLIFDTPKADASYRRVPIRGRTLALFKLAAHDAPAPDALVFHNGAGNPKDPHQDWREWKALLATLGIAHVPLHVARNTASSIFEEIGYPSRLVAELMGQATVSVTHGYQTGDPEKHREMMDAFEAYTAGELEGVSPGRTKAGEARPGLA